jgi:preprotein translocase subunit YajC
MGGIIPFIVMMLVLFGVLYFISIRPQRKRQQEHQQFTEGLKRGDKVITTGGVYGKVQSIGKESALLELESGASMRVSKDSITRKQGR